MPYPEQLHPRLQPMRLASRNGRMYVGPCPFCPDGGEDRFHVWMEASGGRPAERYWCRVCNQSGLLKYLGREEQRGVAFGAHKPEHHRASRPRAAPDPVHIPFYRQLYQAMALWAHSWLLDPCHPAPRAYLHQRGLSDKTIGRYVLGVTLNDPESLVAYLRETCPEAFPYAEEAGLVVTDEDGRQLTHWNLRGRLLFPYIAGGEVVDLRTRTYDAGKGYRSLGPYDERGSTSPFGWDTVKPGTKTVVVTEAEFKALAALQAYHAGELPFPALGQPGLTVFRETWAEQLAAQDVEEVVLCYDSQPRPIKGSITALAPEEQWSLRHGLTCAAAGLRVRVARLPLAPGATKAEIDTFLLQHGAARFQQLIATAPTLHDYHRSFDRAALERHRLPSPSTYPVRRERPTRLRVAEVNSTGSYEAADEAGATLAEARLQIAAQVAGHATDGDGFLVLAHPPGTGKGFNTALGLRQWMQAVPTGDDGSGFLIWTAQRKSQLHDQSGIELIPLAGRHQGNCRKLPEAMALTQKGYSVKDALCMRRCPFVDHCAYLRQFGQEGDFFASTPLLKATGWWEKAGVVVLDEFDPANLINHVQLDSADLAAMSRAHAKAPAVQAVLRWIVLALATTTDRSLSGTLFLDELDRQARNEGACLTSVLAMALGELPPEEERNLLPGLPNGATLADYQALPPSHTAPLLNQLAKELRHREEGRRITSRLEARGGRLELYGRVEHLIQKLARPDQPKIILDATANADLLRAIFPSTPVQVERPRLSVATRVIQVVGRDWAKSSLKRRSAAAAASRHERWVDDVASHIRPDRRTLIVCTLEREEELRVALADRGHTDIVVAHYGALRGSNAYKGYDVILAQVYHPNLDAVVREGRALFADDAEPLDERVVVAPRLLRDGTGAAWRVQVPTFADRRLHALLEQRREAELLHVSEMAIRVPLAATTRRPVRRIDYLPPVIAGPYREHLSYLEPEEHEQPYLAVLTSYDFAGEWDATLFHELISLNLDISIAVDVVTLNRSKSQRVAEMAYNAAKLVARDASLVDIRGEQVVYDAREVLGSLKGQTLHAVQVAILVRGKTNEELEANVVTVRDLFGARLKLLRPSGAQSAALKLFSTLPRKRLDAPWKPRTQLSKVVGCAAGMVGFHRPNQTRGVFVGVDRNGRFPIFINLFERNQAAHMIIAGQSGYGKTVRAPRHAVVVSPL